VRTFKIGFQPGFHPKWETVGSQCENRPENWFTQWEQPHTGLDQMLAPFSTRFSSRFSQWELIDTFKCENRTENRPQVLTWSKTGYENRFKCVYIYVFEKPNRFSHRCQIRFSEFSVSFIGSSCSSSHLGLLLFSCCYYCSPIITVLSLLVLLFSLLLLLFSHCSYSFPAAVTFLRWCCSFRVMKSFNY